MSVLRIGIPKRQEKSTTTGSLEDGFETIEEAIRRSSIVAVDPP
jgi:hypothetical protein